MEVMKCQKCNKVLTDKTEIEYSGNLGDYFCNPDCAMDYYFDYMQSVPYDVHDPANDLKERNIEIINGKLYDTSY